MNSPAHSRTSLTATDFLNRVPQITAFFWVIKVLATTVGETGADYLNEALGLGLTGTSAIMAILLVIVLVVQFGFRRYVPAVYWLAVVLISVVGTLITDNMVDNLGVSLPTATTIFAVALAAVFLIWNRVENTLSVHTIVTFRREAFYWLAILFTFALGTAAGDLVAESLDLGYLVSAIIFGGLILAVATAHYVWKLNGILAFWLAYILTRPLGASLGDYLSQPVDAGGIAIGTVATSALFLAIILALVLFLSFSKIDRLNAGRPTL